MRLLFGPSRAPRLSLDAAARRVLDGDLGVGEAARLTGRKKADIARAVDHAIYRQSRIGLEDSRARHRPPWWRRWPVVVAATILAIEAIAALAVFHDNIRALIVSPPAVMVAPPPRPVAPSPPSPVVPSLDKLLPSVRSPVAPPASRPPVPPPATRPSSPPQAAQLHCPIEPGPRAALAAICRGASGPFAPPDCECLQQP